MVRGGLGGVMAPFGMPGVLQLSGDLEQASAARLSFKQAIA